MKKAMVLTALGILMFTVPAAIAATVYIDEYYSEWQNPIGGGGTVIIDGPKISWGSGGDRSGYEWLADGLGDVDVNKPFELGKFTHNNYPITAGTGITGVEMALGFRVGSTEIGFKYANYLFTYTHNETSNVAGECEYPSVEPCSDYVTVSPLYNDEISFLVGTDDEFEYYFSFLGFSGNDGFTAYLTFVTEEYLSNSASIYGIISTIPIDPGGDGWLPNCEVYPEAEECTGGFASETPEPGSLLLLGTGIAGLGVVVRRKMKK